MRPNALAVVALGGNALLPPSGDPHDLEAQRAAARTAAEAIASLAATHRIVVTHGNGPQIGALALAQQTADLDEAWPLDVLGAEVEGLIGYLLEQELARALPDHDVATLLTRVMVDPRDPAFDRPTKAIGPTYDADRARQLERDRGWTMVEDHGGYRRAVPSPEPAAILGIEPIRLLETHDVITVCAGGGGLPVTGAVDGSWFGLEAVIDKDLVSSLLATELDADALVLLTDVDGVYAGWGTADARLLALPTLPEARALDLPAGSMRPKVEAACRFIEGGGGFAAIGSLADAEAVATDRAGTRFHRPAPI